MKAQGAAICWKDLGIYNTDLKFQEVKSDLFYILKSVYIIKQDALINLSFNFG